MLLQKYYDSGEDKWNASAAVPPAEIQEEYDGVYLKNKMCYTYAMTQAGTGV